MQAMKPTIYDAISRQTNKSDVSLCDKDESIPCGLYTADTGNFGALYPAIYGVKLLCAYWGYGGFGLLSQLVLALLGRVAL